MKSYIIVRRFYFKIDNSDELITYKLLTNPDFVTVLPCCAGPNGEQWCFDPGFPVELVLMCRCVSIFL